MNVFSKFFLSVATALTIVGCSDDVVNRTGNGNEIDPDMIPGVYMGVTFQMPGMGQTRSFTSGEDISNSGTEVGTDIENNVNEVIVVLARKDDYGFIAAATVMRDKIYKHTEAMSNLGAYHAAAKFNKTELSQYYTQQDDATDKEVAVFVIVNPTGGIVDKLKEIEYGDVTWFDEGCKVDVEGTHTEGSIWSTTNGGNFLMTNSEQAIRLIPKKMDDWDKYTTEANPFSLSENNDNASDGNAINNSKESSRGPVKVQRAAARLDFRDGSPIGNRTYHVVYLKNEQGQNDEKYPIIDVKLNKMCLVNMGNEFFYLKRVSNNGLDGTTRNRPAGWQLCGPEKPWYTDENGKPVGNLPGNYVVDYWSEAMSQGISTGFSNYFNYPFFDNDGKLNEGTIDSDQRWAVYQIEDVLNGSTDHWTGAGSDQNNPYHVWRYVTENTIPGDIEKQVNGISTGVVFKGKLQANETLLNNLAGLNLTERQKKALEELIKAVNDNPNESEVEIDSWHSPFLYSYAGSLYCGWENLWMAAIEASFSYSYDATGDIVPDWNRTTTFYRAVFGNGGTGYELTVNGKTYTDDMAIDPESAYAKWKVWDAAGKPSTNPASNESTSDLSAEKQAEIAAQFKAAVTTNNITIYQRSKDNRDGWGYYCYYYYWNRHNNNEKNGIMGPMEFATVRNNVYKLSVTHIAKLGHPRRADNDPDNPKPDTPDENANIYITVDSEVIPWVVRINDIVFE